MTVAEATGGGVEAAAGFDSLVVSPTSPPEAPVSFAFSLYLEFLLF
jgi:hypothetical protein